MTKINAKTSSPISKRRKSKQTTERDKTWRIPGSAQYGNTWVGDVQSYRAVLPEWEMFNIIIPG